jgi:hypothetical protein
VVEQAREGVIGYTGALCHSDSPAA